MKCWLAVIMLALSLVAWGEVADAPGASVWRVSELHLRPRLATGEGPGTGLLWQWRDFQWPAWGLDLPEGHLLCPTAGPIYPRLHCLGGRLQARWRQQGQVVRLDYPLALDYDFLAGRGDILLRHQAGVWQVRKQPEKGITLHVTNWPLAEIFRLLRLAADSPLASLQGGLTADAQLNDKATELAAGHLALTNMQWESPDGALALAGVKLQGDFSMRQPESVVRPRHQQVVTITQGQIDAGEALLGDFYFDFSQQPVRFSLKAWFSGGILDKLYIAVEIPAVLTARLTATDMATAGLSGRQSIQFNITDLDRLNRLYLKDFLALKGLADADLSGTVSGMLRRANKRWQQASIRLTDVALKAVSRKLAARGLGGQIEWLRDGPVPPSQLHWQSVLLAGMPVQAAGLGFFFVGDSLRFPDHSYLPVFDGALVVDHLFVNHLFSPAVDIDFSGRIEPISLALITEKMGWPIMHGTIAGTIPGMRKQGEQIVFDGVIDVAVFEGRMQISHLAMERLFGVAPVIAADIAFEALNLKQITTTFDFGEITGLVSGQVEGLRITNWKTDRMDAEIHSVKRKGIKQTLSQKALDRISSLGGVQGAISRSFLRFFERFRYRRLGLRCRLRREVCEMGGIRPFNGGYLLVEGGGLPRVNIIGYQRFIDWEEFLGRLLNRDYDEARVQ